MVSLKIFELQKVGQGHELQGHLMRRWMAFYVLQVGEQISDLSQTVVMSSTNEAYGRTDGRTDGLTDGTTDGLTDGRADGRTG